jgi:anti-sigma B factor antagonist
MCLTETRSKRRSPCRREADRKFVRFETTERDGWIVVHPGSRRLDVACATELKERLTALVESGHRRVILDLEDVEYLDSAGLGAIVSARKAIERRDDFILAGVAPRVRGLLELTGLTRILRLARSVDEAMVKDAPQRGAAGPFAARSDAAGV